MRGGRLPVWVALVVVVGGGVAEGALARAHVTGSRSDPVLRAITGAVRSGAVGRAQAAGYRETYISAVAEVGRLHGQRAQELQSAVAIVRGIAARNSLGASRMALVFLTLARNAQWWSSHGPPPAGAGLEPAAQGRSCKPLERPLARAAAAPNPLAHAPLKHLTRAAPQPLARAANLTFPGSGIVYEYYPGMGLQLQVNATFGSVNALLTEGSPRSLARAGEILDEMLTLASSRYGRLAWEYEFPFEGGVPPWTSGLSQATAIEALTRAAAKLRRPDYLPVALRLAQLFGTPSPKGVRLHLSGGDWFLLYSFAPHQVVLNADLNALVALHDLAVATHAPLVSTLERNGLRALERDIASFNTGSWSLYAEGGPLASLNYQALNYELAQKLCQRTGISVVCAAAKSFDRELNERCPLIKHGAQAADAFDDRLAVSRPSR